VKNFQIIPYVDALKNVNIKGFLMQFGKFKQDTYKLDVQYPFSVFQAFGLALSTCDCD